MQESEDQNARASSEKIQRRHMACQQRKKLQQKRLCMVTAFTLTVAILVGIIVNLIVPDRTFSDNENRSLTSLPQFSFSALMDGSYTAALQSYVADQFVGRDGWITLKLNEDRARGVRESNGVYLGKNGYLIEKPADPKEQDVQHNLDAVSAFVKKFSTLHYHMTLVPNAASILSDKLPAHAPVRDQQADLKSVRKRLPAKVVFTDVTAALTAHKEEAIYYHTDHHWTSLGADYAFQAMAPGLGISKPITNYDIYTVTNSFEGTMASKSGCYDTKDSIEVYTPRNSGSSYFVTYEDTHKKSASLYQSAALKTKDKYTVFFGGNHPRITIQTTNNNHKRLLLLKDSYANCFVQFLTPYYEEIVMIDPRYYYDDIGKVISSEDITDVLFLYNLNTYLSDTSLADVLSSATAVK